MPASRKLLFIDRLLSRDGKRRIRVTQTLVAIAVTLPALLIIQLAAWMGIASWREVSAWTLSTLGGSLAFLGAIRSGWSERFEDPSLTVGQMLFALASCAVGYAIAGPIRGVVFPLAMVALMFGMFSLTPRKALGVSIYAVLAFGTVMWVQSRRGPDVFPPDIEFAHFLMLAAMMPAVSLLAAQLSRLRGRLRRRTRQLEEAVERIQVLATRDDLTGLINRRQISELLERERQRALRTGAHFCIALIDLDHFKRVNDGHGHGAGDQVLREFASKGMQIVRATDALGRWGGEEFLLLMPDSWLPNASQGAERLRRSLEQLEVQLAGTVLKMTLSAGVVQYQTAESAQSMIERADTALYCTKSEGRNRVVIG